ncbi:sulfite exporter TauE/SafE family protein [Paracoccus sp. (in: a-proteobacteria)]|uniref:sulfite exporter TauE/SafE family protein n=1 Tax=Paracoccus sp. TaxID=267 RepID=UPI00322084F6
MTELAALLDPSLIGLWAVVGLAAWLQTLTGFAFGLILMGGVGLFDLIPLPEAAILASILTLVNGGMVVGREWRSVDRPALALFMAGSLPGLALGYVLLLWLVGGALSVLQLVLGVLILGAALQMMRRPVTRAHRSAAPAFVVTGFLGGMMGGMFSTAGPPVIWHMYRQPATLNTIRATLVSIFVLNGSMRLVLVLATTGIPATTLVATAGAVPVVALGTHLAQRHPPPLSAAAIRRLAFGLLFLSGLALSLPALLQLMKAVLP